VKQKEQESSQVYTKHFKTARDVIKSHIGGPIILMKYVEKMTGYDRTKPDEVQKAQEKAFSQFLHIPIWIMRIKQNTEHY
jgi:hypothetical protein